VVGLTEPYFLDQRLSLGGQVFYSEANYLSSAYDQRNYGLFTGGAASRSLMGLRGPRLQYNKITSASSLSLFSESSGEDAIDHVKDIVILLYCNRGPRRP